MLTTLDATDATDAIAVPLPLAYAEASKRLEIALEAPPNTLVLQPNQPLDQANSPEFQHMLEAAIDRVTDAVIVDLLWVRSVDSYGIAALVAGTQRAAAAGKLLSFQSMATGTQVALDAAWEHQRESSHGAWSEVFADDLECFLNSFTHRKI